MSIQIILAGLGIFALLGAYVMFKLKQARREIEQLLKTNAQLQMQKAVVETQVKHFEVRKKMKKTLVTLAVMMSLTACSNQPISVINQVAVDLALSLPADKILRKPCDKLRYIMRLIVRFALKVRSQND